MPHRDCTPPKGIIMSRTVPCVSLPLLLSLLFIMVLVTPAFAASEKPNIVFILADDLTRWDIGCYGSKDSRTPALDKLAADGMKFNKCYQAAAMCAPTRQNLLTGMYPTRNGGYPNHSFVYPGVKSVVHYLKPLGYRVALIGKEHVGPKETFDYESLGSHGYHAVADMDRIRRFMTDAKSKSQPFCLFVMLRDPHLPWDRGNPSLFDADKLTLPPNWVDNITTRDNFRRYLAEINFLDGQVKDVVDMLGTEGLTDDTVVMFASEHGSPFPFAKWTSYSVGTGSALIVKWPGQVAAGMESDAIVEYSDIVPTFIDIAGGKLVPGLDGSSIVPVLKQQTDKHKDFSYGIQTSRGLNNGPQYYPIRSITNGSYRLIVNLAFEAEMPPRGQMDSWLESAKEDPEAAEIVDKWKNRPRFELYNEETDKWNMNNLAGDPAHADILNELEGELEKWMEYANDRGMETELTAYDHLAGWMTKCQFSNEGTVHVHLKRHHSHSLSGESSGLQYRVFKRSLDTSPAFAGKKPDKSGVAVNLDSSLSVSGTYGVVFEGYMDINIDGHHTFYLKNSGKADMYVDDELVVSMKTGHSKPCYGTINLEKGFHRIKVQAITSDGVLKVTYSYPGMMGNCPQEVLENSIFFHGGEGRQ